VPENYQTVSPETVWKFPTGTKPGLHRPTQRDEETAFSRCRRVI
jgi:hypothetical protein